jgi:hypothetical protein
MLENLSNKTVSNVADEINLIVHWSVDEWEWNTLTKEIIETIEEYDRY